MHFYREESAELATELKRFSQRWRALALLGGKQPTRGHVFLFPVEGSTQLYVYPDDPVIMGLTGYDEKQGRVRDLDVDAQSLKRLEQKGIDVYKRLLTEIKLSAFREPDFITFVKIVDQIVKQYQSQQARISMRELRKTFGSLGKSLPIYVYNEYTSRIPELKEDGQRTGDFLIDRQSWEKIYQELMKKAISEKQL